MDVLIIGAGAIGIALGASLGSNGVSVSYVATSRTGSKIEEGGVHRTGLFGSADVPAEQIKVYYDYADLPSDAYDYVCICAKTMANEQISEALSTRRDCLKEDGIIVILQNGWGNDTPYLRFFDPSVVYNARVITGFERTSANVSNITVHTAPILIGSLHGYPKEKGARLAEVIDRSGIPSCTSDEIEKALWAKMLYNCTLNPLGAILKVAYGKLADCAATKATMDRLIAETFAVMDAAGYRTFWSTPEEYKAEFYGKLVPDTKAHFSSTYQDLEKHQKTEIETLTGTIIKIGEKYGVDTPTHKTIYEQIIFLEENSPA